MIDAGALRRGWALLDRRERRHALVVLSISIVGALSSAAMVGSILPFLSALARPERIHSEPILAQLYALGGFQSEFNFLVALGIFSLTIILAANAIQIVRAWAVNHFALMRGHTISHRLLETYLKQNYEYFLDRHSGTLSTRVLSESQHAVISFLLPATEVVAAVTTVAALVALVVWVNPAVALGAFAVLGGIYGGTFVLSRRMIERLGRERALANTARYRIANEALGGVKVIKLLGRERTYVDRFEVPSRRMYRSMILVSLFGEVPQYVMQAVAFGAMIVLCLALMSAEGFASGSALAEILPILGVFAFAGQRLLPELARVYRGLTQLKYGVPALDAVHADFVHGLRDPPLPASSAPALGLSRELRLEAVSYRYPNADRPGLSDVTAVIPAGARIGIVGSTGAGKTTLADIVLGLLTPTEGRLVVDGTALSQSNERRWRQTVGYVPQDIFLVDASIAENIALGVSPEAISMERVCAAAKIAQIDQFVTEELPAGYDTTVGERGVRLSGGQRQRVGIARALYHDADLIVFDEATSALDNLTEREVMQAIDTLPGDKTVVMIAHRLSTVRRCDRIMVLEKGRLVGYGDWDTLMRANEVFREIVDAA